METIVEQRELAGFTARVILGLLFFFQGYDAIFRIKLHTVVDTYLPDFQNRGIPAFLVTGAAWYTSWSELIGGFLLIIGLLKIYALYFLGFNLIIAALGFGIVTPVWDMRHVFPRLALLLFLIIIPESWDMALIDNLLASHN